MNSKTKIRLFFALEVIIWLLLIVLCVGSFRIHQAKKNQSLPAYRIFMQDVDGLIEGASVRMMGVPIGYVKTISIVQDNVYVKFVLTNQEVKLPQGVIATVEFNGMAGSKSLELYPPDDAAKASGKLVTIKKTNRLGAALGLFDDMFAKLDSILIRCDHFSTEVEHLMPKSEHSNMSVNLVTEASSSVNIINSMIDAYYDTRNRIKTNLQPKTRIQIYNKEESQPIEEEVTDGQQ